MNAPRTIRQQTGRSAAEFVDWKFHRDYLLEGEQEAAELNQVRLDAMIASHADADHYGGLRDLVGPASGANACASAPCNSGGVAVVR